MDFLEVSGNTVDEATKFALSELNCTLDEVIVEILDEGSKGFLGIGKKFVKIRVSRKFNPEETVREFLRELTASMGIATEAKIRTNGKNMYVVLSGENMGVLIGKRGVTLEALQYITNLVINKGQMPYINVILDIENYRERRKKSLEILATNLAKKVKATGKPVVLEPMNAMERRIIHYILEKDKNVITSSRGEEPHRHVVIGRA